MSNGFSTNLEMPTIKALESGVTAVAHFHDDQHYGPHFTIENVVAQATLDDERLYQQVHTHLALRAACGIGSWVQRVTSSINNVVGHGVDMHPHQIY